MKRLSLFCAALFAAMTSFATISYELNGGSMSGYANPEAMYHDLNADYNTATGGTATWVWITDPANIATGLPTQQATWDLTFLPNSTKWAWLGQYLDAACADQGKTLPSTDAAFMRYNLAAFFCNTVRTGWPASADYTTCGVGTLAAYQAYWKSGFANPTDPTEATTLQDPYKEGYTFDGWYAAADFSGDKLTSVDATTTGTLYAKWIEYVPTIAEALAADSAAAIKCGGVVTYIRSKNVYIQDATGAVLLYTTTTPTVSVGDYVVVTGNNVIYGGAPEISNAVITSSEAGHELPGEITTTIATLLNEPLKNFGKRVYVEGVRAAYYDNKGNLWVADGTDTVQCYYVTPAATDIPVGKKVNLHLLAGYYNKFQFVGPTTGVELAPTAGRDAYNYPEVEGYTLENKWLYSNVLDNFTANVPAPTDMARGMVAYNGKMYFINRNNASFTVIDGTDGEMLAPIAITGEHLFQAAGEDGTYASCVTLPFNDVKIDQAGNFLIGACVSGSNRMMIYKVDITTGAATELINESLYANEEWGADLEAATTKWRFDAFNVYGDVNGHAIVMAADANSFYVYKWEIENGVAGAATRIDCTPEPTDNSLLVSDGAVTATAFGTAPQIFPVDFDYFYVDGFNHLPMLFDMDGTLMEDFATAALGVNVPMGTDTLAMNFGHNGLCEFQVGDEYFLVLTARNTVSNNGCASAFAVYKFADAAKSFADMTPLFYFPKNGMGVATNGCRTAVPSVEVIGNKAMIYVYTNNNGYGVYEFTGKEATPAIEHMWIIGEVEGATWVPGNSPELTKTAENVFEISVTLTGKWFAFVTSIDNCTGGENPTTDWDVINSHRFGSNPSGAEVAEGVATPITGVNGDFSFLVPEAGTYHFVVDLNAMTVTATRTTGLDNTDANTTISKVVENGHVYIIKNGVRYSVLGAEVK